MTSYDGLKSQAEDSNLMFYIFYVHYGFLWVSHLQA